MTPQSKSSSNLCGISPSREPWQRVCPYQVRTIAPFGFMFSEPLLCFIEQFMAEATCAGGTRPAGWSWLCRSPPDAPPGSLCQTARQNSPWPPIYLAERYVLKGLNELWRRISAERDDSKSIQNSQRNKQSIRRAKLSTATCRSDRNNVPRNNIAEIVTDRFRLVHGNLGGVDENGGVVVPPLRAASRDRDERLVRVVMKCHVNVFLAPPEKARPLRGHETDVEQAS